MLRSVLEAVAAGEADGEEDDKGQDEDDENDDEPHLLVLPPHLAPQRHSRAVEPVRLIGHSVSQSVSPF